MTEVDVSAAIPGFQHSRIWRNTTTGNANYDGPNGYNWDIEEWPYLIQRTKGTSVTINVRLGSRQLRIDKNGSDYVVRHNQKDYYSFSHDTTNHLYVLSCRTPSGIKTTYFQDFDQTTNPVGLLWKQVQPNGFISQVDSYTTDGNIDKLVAIRGSQYFELDYDYNTSGSSANRISSVTLSQLDHYPTPSVRTPIRRMRYRYYDGSNDYGLQNDLEAAILQNPTGNAAPNDWADIAVTYYRYYKADSATGYPHGLKYVVNAASYAELIAAGQDPLAGAPSGTDLVPAYADHYFEYGMPYGPGQNKSHWVTKEIARACAACGNSGGTSDAGETFTSTKNPNYPTSSASSNYLYNTWKYKTVSLNSGGFQKTIYANRTNQVMLEVIQELGTGGPVRRWCTYTRYDASGRLIFTADPSAVSGFDEAYPDLVGLQSSGAYIYLRNTSGLIRMTTQYASTTATSTTAGGVEGWEEYRKVKEGVQGDEIKLSYRSYIASSNTTGTVAYALATSTVYPDSTTQDATAITTSYSYLWYAPSGDVPAMMKQRVTTLPVVPTTQNGDGQTYTIKEYFDSAGNLTWKQDERGIVTSFEYDTARGLLTRMTADVGTVSNPPGWTVTSGTHFNYITDYEYDLLGRQTLTLGPSHDVVISGSATTVRSANYSVYVESPVSAQSLDQSPVGDQLRTGRGYWLPAGSGSYTLIDPVTISFSDKLGRNLDRVVSKRSTGSGRLVTNDTFLRADWSRWSVMSYTLKGQLEYKRDYVLIPTQSPDLGLNGINSTPGVVGTNYYETFYGYDPQTNMRVRVKSPNGTITRTVFDKINRPAATYVGTNDIPTSGTWENWTPGAAGTNLLQTDGAEYDNGNAGGPSSVTKSIANVDTSTLRQTLYTYDFRHRAMVTDGEVTQYVINIYDNLDRVVRVDQQDTSASGHLIGRMESFYDNRGRAYQTKRYAVDPATGTVGNALIGNIAFDAAGNVENMVNPGDAAKSTRSTYDNLSRRIARNYGYDDLSATNGRLIVESSQTTYDAANNVLIAASGDLNVGAGLTSQTFRTSYTAYWYDGIDRQIAVAQYGTASSFSRPGMIPARSDIVLVTTQDYDSAGMTSSVIDPMGRETRSTFDQLGRMIKTIENYTGTGVPATPNADNNRTTQTTYTPTGQIATLTAVMTSSADNQVTTYIYGTTLADGSDLVTNNWLRETIYPDGTTGTDSVRMSYNRYGQITKKIDQAGTTHEYRYDLLGRLRHDMVTTFGTNVDSAVQRLTTEYEVRGMPSSLSSAMTAMPNTSSSGGNVINQVALAYNAFGQLVKDTQSHDGTMIATDPSVQYGYADGTGNNVSHTSFTYPNGRVMSLTYGASGSIDAGLLRVSSVQDSATTGNNLLAYAYLGRGKEVRKTFTPLSSGLDLWGGTAGTYTGLDRFDRVIDQNWTNGTTSTSRHQYGYDRNSNRLWRADLVAEATSKPFDELYAYDGLNRLTDMQRGLLNSAKIAMQSGTGAFEQTWGLDPVGNWKTFNQDINGIGSFDLVQTRSNSKANEITGITKTAGPAWVTPAYDLAGNATTFPKTTVALIPADPTQAFQGVYDAWNRLVKITAGSAKVAGYVYDARNHRIRRRQYDTSGVYASTLDDFWSDRWQLLEVRTTRDPNAVGTSVMEQYVWGQSEGGYVDELVLRDRDYEDIGVLEERLFVNQDANYNVTTVLDGTDAPTLRFAYAAYGNLTQYTSDYQTTPYFQLNWCVGHQGLYQDLPVYTSFAPVPGSGLVYNRNRYLHSELGRFIQPDPLKYRDGQNYFQYCQSNATNYIDSYGLYSVCCRSIAMGFPANQLTHCNIVDGACPQGDTSHPVTNDKSPKRTLQDCGKSCDQATQADIDACAKKYPYKATPLPTGSGSCTIGGGEWGNNCETSTLQTLSACCMQTPWVPDPYAGPDTPCLTGHFDSSHTWICDVVGPNPIKPEEPAGGCPIGTHWSGRSCLMNPPVF